MAAAKKTAPAKSAGKGAPPAKAPPAKATPKPAAGAKGNPPPAKPAPTATPGKPAAQKPGALPASAGAKMHAADDEAPVVVPKLKLEKHAGRDTLCQIEIVKEGHFFIARTQTEGGQAKEYKNTVFEDLLTEMVITLQEQLQDK